MPDELKDLTEYPTVLVMSEAEKMLTNTAKVIKTLLKKCDAGVFITVNQPYTVIEKMLGKNGVDVKKLYFVDCISETAGGKPKQSKHCLYVTSPSNLTEIGIGLMQILKALGDKKKFVFIDSLGTFLTYNSAGTMSKFSHFIITKISLEEVSGVLMAVDNEMDQKLIDDLKVFCQKTIKLK
jgi:hypothetical protein